MPLFFWFDLFLEARAQILKKISLVFWSKQWHQKDILKLSDLYWWTDLDDHSKTLIFAWVGPIIGFHRKCNFSRPATTVISCKVEMVNFSMNIIEISLMELQALIINSNAKTCSVVYLFVSRITSCMWALKPTLPLPDKRACIGGHRLPSCL